MIKVVVDSTADMPPQVLAANDITAVPVLIQFGNETLRDGLDIDKDEFFRRMAEADVLPRTAAPSVGMFEEAFRRLSADGSEILSISLAGGLSATFGAARQAAALVEGARITCFDSMTTTAPMGYLAVAAARAARAGRTLEEIVTLLEELRERVVLYVALDTLRYLEKGGRIGRMRALLGTMLSVKPILEVRHSEVLPVEQVRTWKRVPQRMIELMAGRGPVEQLTVLYTAGRDQALQLADMTAAAGLLSREQIQVVQAGAALGCHTGPGALGLAGLLK